MNRIHDTVDPRTLVDHPLNVQLYGASRPDDDFLDSIKRLGVLNPVEITKNRVVISGHRRKQAAVIAELPLIEVLIHTEDLDDLVIRQRIIESNRNREKTREQCAREYAELVRVEKELAKRRQATSTGGAAVRSGKSASTKVVEAEKAGVAKRIAAAKIGMSAPTAEKAAEVVQKIDEAEAAGDAAKAAELRQELNEGSVAAAHRKATGEADAPSGKSAAPPGVVLDENRQCVPEEMHFVFQARAEFDDMANQLREVLRTARRLTNYKYGSYIRFDELKLELDKATQNLRLARPHIICPWCKGNSQPCESCRSQGWVPKSVLKEATEAG